VTLFYAAGVEPGQDLDRDTQRLIDYLESLGYPTSPVTDLLEILHEDGGSAQKQPVHGVGIEVPVGAHPKINLYLQPVI